MNANEIVRALRWLAKDTEFIFAAENLNDAADMIESLQAQLSASHPENDPHTNDALTRDELYYLDGEPLYVMDGEGHECYCVVNTKNEDCIDNEAGAWCFEFYDMTGDGKHGLHKMGWRAYRTKPERSELE